MAKIWRNRIIAGTQSYDNCPLKYKDAVKALLRQDVENGVITREQYKEYVHEDYD